MNTSQQLQHLYWRAGFGPRPQDVAAGLSPRKALRQLLRDSEQIVPLDGADLHYTEPQGAVLATMEPAKKGGRKETRVDPATMAPLPLRSALATTTMAGPVRLRRSELTPEQRKQRNNEIRDAYLNMSTAWLDRMANSPAQLREKMTLFWHGHFACRIRRPDAALSLHNTMHRLALGKFPDLLRAVSQEAAMLQFLNNQQNRKQHPNENFAREVMELFTLGRGNYTEQDVKEAARAFTGWGYDREGNFRFRAGDHDDGPKTFLGRTGNFGGEDVLRIILEQPAAATFLTTKIYRFFVNDVPNPDHVNELANSFRRSGYDVGALMEQLFSADWFYEPANVGTHIKSPVELLTGLRRTLNLRLDNPRPLLAYQKALGQSLFQPPNVAGWAGGRNWIDSSSLLLRLQLPAVLLKNAEFRISLKDDENDLNPHLSRAERQLSKGPGAHLPLAPLQALLGKTPAPEQADKLSRFLLQSPIRPENLSLVQAAASQEATPEAQLRTTLLSVLSLPEYQLA